MATQGIIAARIPITEDIIRPQMLTLREFRPFKTSDEYLWAMKEDLSDWLSTLYPELSITPHTFMECLETGVVLCKHANNVKRACVEWINAGGKLPKCWGKEWKLPNGEVTYNPNARSETFFARDNVHNFITWCRKLGIFECLLFESDDLILRKHEKNVILCLLEVARRGSYFGMATPLLVQFEKEIDRDIAKDTGQELSSSGEEEESYIEYGPIPQIITNDLRSLDEMVRELVERCSCPTQFPMIRVAEGKYRIGNTKVMIYVRILRNHVMVRVGGGWDTLAHYLDKHDPCRCSAGHRATVASKLIMKGDGVAPRMKVEYERSTSFDPVAHSTPNYGASKKQVDLSDSGSEISDEGYKTSDNTKLMTEIINGSSSAPDFKQPPSQYRSKHIGMRSRPGSTDEDRPDSRSTDEEFILPTVSQPKVIKSSSSSRVVPKSQTHQRNPINERGRSFGRISDAETSDSSGTHTLPRTTGVIKSKSTVTANKRPARSLSAGGSQEFYGKSSTYAASQRSTRNIPAGSRTPLTSRAAGKNTWNGSNVGPRPRLRGNLFQDDLFHNKHEVMDQQQELVLANLIKAALELPSNDEKISHITLALEQLEARQPSRQNSVEGHSVSLPYNSNSAGSSPVHSKSVTIKKRKDNGSTKIPKPVFY
ncbi:unnamed protein product [Orchesella dallaii]|uniref:GAS2-like protein 1 n=1 Tax=Orchesella dallaii TaxID=48710 RepID=A0ABP1R0Y7_9HEXA